MSLALSIENLSKLYRLGTITRGMLWDDARRWFRNRVLGSDDELATAAPDNAFFWALKNVSFQIKQGESIGIIGQNGAGKSTLLKILSRITSPSSGLARINGRVGSLLEVGTGFHPELTGRDNIYLYGSILGMKRAEINSKFDAIVSFAELEQFIDTPVKRYSSGMTVRLGFSVAAFLEPEILILDEVLAVGDMKFRNRCVERIEEIVNDGRTLLFVSHSPGYVHRVCKRSLYFKKGELIFDGSTSDAMEIYQEAIGPQTVQVSGDDA